MLWRLIAWAVAAALLIAAGSVLALQVEVGSAGVSCGSSLDVISGRTGWEEWWAQDLADPADEAGGRLVRAEDCAGAINARTAIAGVLAVAAAAVAVAGEVVARRRPAQPGRATGPSPAQQLRRLGTVLGLVGAALTVGGLVAILFLVADPDSTLFLYVDRLVVTIIGAIVLIPALALAFAGRALDLAGRHLARSQQDDAAA